MWIFTVCTAMALCAAASSTATADRTASFYDGQGSKLNFSNALGWFFTPIQDIVVTKLGVYDLGSAGFADSHEIGIFTLDDAPLVTTFINAGLSGELIDGTRFVDVDATPLLAGTSYYIIADNVAADLFAFETGHVTYAPEIQWDGQGGSNTNSIFDGMTNFGPQEGNLGPNFQFIPAPASIALLAMFGLAPARRSRTV